MGKMKYRGFIGVTLAAMTLLSLAPGASAMADDAQNNLVPVNIPTDNSASIKIKGSKAALDNHSFKAVRVGTYVDAMATPAPDNKIMTVSVGTDPAAKSAATAVLSSMDSVDAAYKGNPIGQVASKWLGYATSKDGNNKDEVSNNPDSAWGGINGGQNEPGKLRSFIQALDSNSDFRNLVGTAREQTPNLDSCSDDDQKQCTETLTGLQDGLYVVIDTTAGTTQSGGTNAIPMLVSTAIGNYNQMQDSANPTLGEIDMKNADTTVLVDWNNPHHNGSTSVNAIAEYNLHGVTPMSTSFSHYKYVMTVIASPGQVYNGADPTVTIGDTNVGPITDSNPNGVYTYTKTATADGGTKLVFDFSDRILQYPANRDITISYAMKITQLAAVNRKVTTDLNLQYSKDAHDDSVMGSVDATLPIYLGRVRMSTGTRTANGSTPSVAGFVLTRDSDGKAIPFTKVADGKYEAADDKSPNPVTTVVSANGADAQSGGFAKGDLEVSGLGYDTYTVKQVSGQSGLMSKVNPSLKVTLAPKQLAGGATDPSEVQYTNSTDAWHLVPANSFSNGVLPVLDASSATQLPLDGAAGWLMSGAVVVLLVVAVVGLTALRRRASAARA